VRDMISTESRKKFNELFYPIPGLATWRHRVRTDQDNSAWNLSGEFGIFAEIGFERHLKRIYEHKTAGLQKKSY